MPSLSGVAGFIEVGIYSRGLGAPARIVDCHFGATRVGPAGARTLRLVAVPELIVDTGADTCIALAVGEGAAALGLRPA